MFIVALVAICISAVVVFVEEFLAYEAEVAETNAEHRRPPRPEDFKDGEHPPPPRDNFLEAEHEGRFEDHSDERREFLPPKHNSESEGPSPVTREDGSLSE